MNSGILDRLPQVRGRYLCDVPLAPSTWFRVGGPAEVTFKPADVEDLRFFMRNCPTSIPVHIIGVGSNLLVRDGGVSGVVIRLGKGFTNVFVNGTTVDVGAAVLDRNVALLSAEAEIEGFEFLCGIPGTLGGAVFMNAGAYGSDMSQIVECVYVVNRKGDLICLKSDALGFSYRHSKLPQGSIVVGARLKGRPGVRSEIEARINEYLSQREASQPVKSRTGGSTFANPEGCKAWELIDKAGCRGMSYGGAQMSEMHCNFMINTGGATAYDLETLGEMVRDRVKTTSGVELRWEIERLGEEDNTREYQVEKVA